jgi:cellobiose-specific phosphotransferase system component IIC
MARAKIRLDEVADLPPICVCCGEPATQMRRQEFPLNTALSAAIMVTAAMLDALVWTKRGVTLALPVCEYHKRRGRRSNQTFFRGMALTIAFGVAAYVASQFEGAAASYLSVAAMFAFMITIFVAMHEVDDGLAVKSLKDNSFTLSGVNRKFAEAVERRQQCRLARDS